MGGESLDAEERAVVRLLASGRLAEVAVALSKRGRRDPTALLAVTDARARGLAADVPEIEAVLERIERDEPGDSRLRFWGYGILAERLLLELEGSAFDVARHALDELGRQRLPPRVPLALRYARARLSRVASLTWLFTPTAPEGRVALQRLRDAAVAELLACNLLDEVHVSRGLAAGLAAVVAEEDIVENYTRLLDARAAVDDDRDSMFPATLDVFVGLVAFEVGDFEAALEAFDRLERVRRVHPRVRGVAAYGRAFFRIVTGGATRHSLAVMDQALSEVRRHDPRIAQAWHGQLANTLVDMGSRSADHFAHLEAELPAVGPLHAMGRQLLQHRLSVLAGDQVAVDEALAVLETLDAAGYRRRSARHALRLAHDLARSGDMDAAARVHAWGRRRMPRGRRLTIWERWWSRPVEGSPAWAQVPFAPVTTPDSRRVGTRSRRRDEPGLDMQVMAPALAVAADGRAVALSSAQAKLVAALVVAHPVPLNVEQASDLLWPDEMPTATRDRLNSLVYRLRRALEAQGPAIVRNGDLLQLDADRCEADLWRLRRALVKGTPERVEALTSVTGNLCEAQFPYDEHLVDERHRIAGELLRHARAAVRAGEIEPAGLDTVLKALDLSPGDL